jgi:hypothetical protein
MQLYRYFVSQSNEFCRHNPLCCFWTSVCCLFRYRLSPEIFGYNLLHLASKYTETATSEEVSHIMLILIIYMKVKVKSLCLTKHRTMKTYWGSGCKAPRILDLGTRWRWVVSCTPRPLYLQGKSPGTHWIGGWVGTRTILDAVVKRKIPSTRRVSNPRTPNVQHVAQRYTDWAITALEK